MHGNEQIIRKLVHDHGNHLVFEEQILPTGKKQSVGVYFWQCGTGLWVPNNKNALLQTVCFCDFAYWVICASSRGLF